MPLARISFADAKRLSLPPEPARPAAVIQARMGSTRLPGKVLMQLGTKQVLELLVDRVGRASGIGALMIATSDLDQDDAIVSFAKARNIDVYRGDSDDVLSRYCEAATALSLENIVRITADCPLIDPAVIDAVIAAWWNDGSPYDYGGNTAERTFPDGMDTEVITFEALQLLSERATGIDREHVTSMLIRDPEPFNCVNVALDRYLAGVRLTLDTDDDLAKLRWIVREATERDPDFSLEDLLIVEGYG